MSGETREDEEILSALLSDQEALAAYPVLFTAASFSPAMQEEIAVLVLRAYQAGKKVGARR